MSKTEQIKIVQIGRKQLPSKFKPGETFTITTVMDDKNRKLAALGQWSEGWKEGDTIEGIIEEKQWTDKDGFQQTSLNIKNPNQQTFVPYPAPAAQTATNPSLVFYEIAAQLAPLLFKDKKGVKLDDIDKLVAELKKRIEGNTSAPTPASAPAADNTPSVNVDAEDDNSDDDGDEEPF
jgi:hypothetical protein